MANIEKVSIVNEITKQLNGSAGVMVTKFDRLPAVEINNLRRKLEKDSSRLIVTKCSLLKRALASANMGEGACLLEGAAAVAVLQEDPVAVAKTLVDFSRIHETFKVCGAVYEGQVLDPAGAQALSQIPGKDVLRAMLLGAMQAPINGLVNVLNGSLRGLVVALTEIKKKKEQAG
ncbi:MAG: 50S ribosomal protein L10 [Candidatus Omnitrophica bacterium]|nr:50S ribosomal protein L10 [Candidatus Omnitrophota bacterium]